MIAHCYLGPVVHHFNDGSIRRFNPSGPVFVYGTRGLTASRAAASEDIKKIEGGNIAARFFIGLNVGDKPTYTIEDIVNAVGSLRKGGASFIAQKGIYIDQKGNRTDEDSVQVVILGSGTKAAFFKEMKALGKKLRERFQQETVILETQNRGIVEDVYAIT